MVAKLIKAKRVTEKQRLAKLLNKPTPWEKPWSTTIQQPGLHVRKSLDHKGDTEYEVVKAIGVDKGNGQCIKIMDQSETYTYSNHEILQSQFQRIEE